MLSQKLKKILMSVLTLSILGNALPVGVLSVTAYADTTISDSSKDVGDKQKFAKAKEKALKFISEYKFSANNDWSFFCFELKKNLLSEGITGVGDSAAVNASGDKGTVSGTISLFMGNEKYTFPFNVDFGNDKNANETSKVKYVKDVNKAKEKTLEFISKYNFTSDMVWNDFCIALEKQLYDYGVNGVGDIASIGSDGVVTGTINLHFLDKDESIPFTAHTSDIKNSGGNAISWIKNADETWKLIVNGQAAIGWKQVGNKWYYLNQSGIMQTGWFKDTDGKWYYLKSNGEMALNENVGGYYINANGVWVS